MAKKVGPKEGQGESVSNLQDVGDMSQDTPTFSVPEGYQERTTDVVGFWDGDKGIPLHFIPESATLHDSDLDATKVSILIRGRCVDPTEVYLGEDVDAADVGDLIGVWAKPGMKSIRDLGGVPVWIRQTGEKEVGKPSPMKTFGVFSKEKGQPIPVEGDYREKSKGVRHMLEGAPLSHANPPAKLPADSANNAPW